MIISAGLVAPEQQPAGDVAPTAPQLSRFAEAAEVTFSDLSVRAKKRDARLTCPHQPHRFVAAEEIEQQPQRLGALGFEIRIAGERELRLVAGDLQKLAVHLGKRDPESRACRIGACRAGRPRRAAEDPPRRSRNRPPSRA